MEEINQKILIQVLRVTAGLQKDLHTYKALKENAFDGNSDLKQKMKEKFISLFLIDMNKVISKGNSDKYSIYKNKDIFETLINSVKENKEWESLFTKIELNRNKIIGHNDWEDYSKYSYMSTEQIKVEEKSLDKKIYKPKERKYIKKGLNKNNREVQLKVLKDEAEREKDESRKKEAPIKEIERFGVVEFERDFILIKEIIGFIEKTTKEVLVFNGLK
jgi:hypothetical protein